ncbi:T9SS type A sorting domain-containing protein [Deminuibacter soli]|uniref:T9SS C-terminal target domain-containing protein n=1 Tax=Deminuibacter soli TaxID=2291815 RepID=A0A3E1NLQ5_9BACT|nr:T9SS type A sorting domain-containing protein [Deminuibacter soli]RFM28728.1 T9SS C-terminal target domain-containing protein [Deminuibacter soli]
MKPFSLNLLALLCFASSYARPHDKLYGHNAARASNSETAGNAFFTDSTLLGSRYLCSDNAVVSLVAPQPSGVTYAWYKNGTLLPGETSYTLTLLGTSIANGDSARYYAVITSGVTSWNTETAVVKKYKGIPPYELSITSASDIDNSLNTNVVCFNNTATLTTTQRFATYNWGTKPDGTATVDNAAIHHVGLTETLLYLTVSDSITGCTSNPVPVNVKRNQFDAPTLQLSNDSLYGNNVKPGTPSYRWYEEGKLISGQSKKYFVPKETGTYSVATSLDATCWLASAPLAVIVPGKSDTALTVSGKTSFCSGDTAILKAGKNITYRWFKNNAAISGATSASLIVTASGTYYAVVSNGLSNDTTRKIVITAYVPAKPVVIIGERGTIDNGENYCYSGTSSTLGTDGAYKSYIWTLPNTTITSGSGVTIGNGNAGTVSVRGIDTNTCVTPAFSFNVINSAADSVPVVTRSGDNLNSSPSTYYRWYFNNTLMAGQTKSFIPVTKQGIYFVSTSSNNLCWNESLKYIALTAANTTPGDSVKVTVYPNPVTGPFNIVLSYKNVKSVTVKVTIVTTGGNVVWQSNKLLFRDKWIRIPIPANLSAGMYIAKVVANDESRSVQILVN